MSSINTQSFVRTIRALLVSLCGFVLVPSPVSAAQVTFQLNLTVQVALGNFDPATDMAYVAGDPLNAWSTAESPLAESTTEPGIWTGTFDIEAAPDTQVSYKFVLSTTAGVIWEGNVGTGGGTGNRTFFLSADSQTLPVAFFNNVSNASTVTAHVTFQIDLSVQTALGAFDPDNGTVSVAGEFNNWSTTAFFLERSAANPDLWSGILSVSGAADSALSFKFVLNGGTWEGNVGVGGSQNRAFVLAQGDQILPIVFFNNVTSVPGIFPVTFTVNLGVDIARGTVDPDLVTVSVAGDFNNWDTAIAPLTRSAHRPDVWTGTLDISGSGGTVLLYKFVLDGGTWEAGDNRAYTLADTVPQEIPEAYFSNVANLGTVSVTAAGAGRITLSWVAGSRVRLQRAAALGSGSWQDVEGTEGADSATLDIGPGPAFFRLSGPHLNI